MRALALTVVLIVYLGTILGAHQWLPGIGKLFPLVLVLIGVALYLTAMYEAKP